jgi:acetylornithine deacetylase/succinyl-diaminopimelate desuccinylase-like protein
MTQAFVDARWDDIVPVLEDYIRIPNKSPVFDPDWEAHGHMERAVELVSTWLTSQGVEGLELSVHRLPGRTPVIVADVPATDPSIPGNVLLYGHLDKQPEMTGWLDGFGPWEPRRDGDRLYGRGAGDDGYAAFAALTAIRAVRDDGGRHARCIVLIEASEESGSPDLPAHIEALAPTLGEIDLVVCLDSGCSDYERLWVTTSLRGLVGFDLRVDVVTEGIHSGASGVVPSSFRILRALLSRIEDEDTGRIVVPELHADIPPERVEQVLAQTWRPALSVTGLAGAPPPQDAGNVLRPSTTAKLSMRLPPTTDEHRALESYVVVDGLVDVVIAGSTVASLRRGQIVGELGIIDGAPRSADVVAGTDARLLTISAPATRALLETSPAFRNAVLHQLADRVRSLDLELEHALATPRPTAA